MKIERLVCCALSIGALAHAQSATETVLHNFGILPPGTKGANPNAGVIRDAKGNLYGTTVSGGSANYGTVYKIDAAGQERVLYSFAGEYAPGGASPRTGVTLDAEGNLYGTTGGGYYNGVVYKVNQKGQETVLYHFCSVDACTDGSSPSSAPVRDPVGNLYGVTSQGGMNNAGVVYKLDIMGVESVLYSFTGGADGSGPNSLIRDGEGNLYGTTAAGGLGKQGVVFKIDTTGAESVVYYFGAGDGATPVSVTRDSAGNIYGVTSTSVYPENAGSVFEIYSSGVERNLYFFKGGSDGANPTPGLVLDSAGNLYGTTTHGGQYSAGVVFKVDSEGNETVIYAFDGTGGSSPVSGVIRDSEGNLYGTTPAPNLGAVYEIDPSGQETVLTDFSPTGPPDGVNPSGNLTMHAGELYGVTATGGTADFGTIFRLDSQGRETILYNFTGGAAGSYPSGNVTLDASGNLYGAAGSGAANQGVIFKLDPSGHETALYSFTGAGDGGGPTGGLAIDSAGNLYGTAASGGFGHGVIYKIDPTGSETVLHKFGGDLYGDDPSGITRDAAGNVYGVTLSGGVANAGLVYKLDPGGHFLILYSFTGVADGSGPNPGLTLDDSGNLYGTTQFGGAGYGVVFKLSPAGQETVLYNFCSQLNCSDGGNPSSGVVRDPAGNLYGVLSNESGYNFGPGQVYMLDPTRHETILWTFTGTLPGLTGLIRDPAGNLFGTNFWGGTKSNGGFAFKIVP